jgi:formimidoylglutamate deiminase
VKRTTRLAAAGTIGLPIGGGAGAAALVFQDGKFRPLLVELTADGLLAVRPAAAAGSRKAASSRSPGSPRSTDASGTSETSPRPERGARNVGAAAAGPWAVLPGFVNAHSHAFQRVLRGRVEGRGGDFWSWRQRMYHAALELDPDDVRIASRAAFLEMLLAGYTGVLEFHYLHHGPLGRPYDEPNAMGQAVLEAAAEVGIRICLLETAYARAGAGFAADPAQHRFMDPSVEAFLKRAEGLRARLGNGEWPLASFGLALHSVRAVPRDWLNDLGAWADHGQFPVHMHVAEQPAEVEACLSETGRRPVQLLDQLGLLSPKFTAVHGIHLQEDEIRLLARSGAAVCACPSTEGNLGDGFVPAARLFAAGVPVCLGTDSHASIDPFVEMRELDYRERLRSGTRQGAAGAAFLLDAASAVGAERGGWEGVVGEMRAGWAADLVVLDGEAPGLCGASAGSLAAHLVVSGSPGLVRDVYVGGKRVVTEGRHEKQEEILRDFAKLQARLWRG